MKLFKDIMVGEHFVMHNGQQLVRVSPSEGSYNCLDYPFLDKSFELSDDTKCLTVDELMAMSEPLTMENSEEVK